MKKAQAYRVRIEKSAGIFSLEAYVYMLAVFFIGICANVKGQNFSVVATPDIPALTNAKVQWADFNNDTELDPFISGTNSGGTIRTTVFISNGDDTFDEIALDALADMAFDLNDYDNDGFIDIITCGINPGGEKKTFIYKNNNGTGFDVQNFSIADLSQGGVIWKDLDRDGDVDILISGLDDDHEKQIFVYRLSEGSYHSVSAPLLSPVSNGAIATMETQQDGSPEIVLTGLNKNGSPVTLIYNVDQELNFTLYSDSQEGITFSTVASGDFNGDNYEDVVFSGLSGSESERKTRVLSNNAVNDFTEVSTSLPGLSASSVDVGDLDNDGLLDIILTGQDDEGLKYFKYFRNASSFSFSDVAHSMENIYNGDVALGDYDKDGDLDIFQVGNSDVTFQANLYVSDQSETTANASPSSPANLLATTSGSSVTLTWDKSSDDHTASNSLTYNLYLSTDVGGTGLLISPLADIATGYRRIPAHGNNGVAQSKTLYNLPEGKYYWSVQAIDNGFMGSAFSPEQSFSICYPVSLGADTTICYKEDAELGMTGDPADVVNWYSKTSGLLAANTNTFSQEIIENDTVIVEVEKSYGCTVRDTLNIAVASLPEVDLGVDKEVCFKNSFSVEVTTPHNSVNWRHPGGVLKENASAYIYEVMAKDTIIAEVYSDYRCVNYDSVIVDVLPLPVFDIGSDLEICFKKNAELHVAGSWASVNWRGIVSGARQLNSSDYEFPVLQKDTIVAEVTDSKGCVNSDSVVVSALALPAVSLGSDQSVCYGESALLQIPEDGNTINWYDEGGSLLAADQHEYLHHVTEEKTLVAEAIDENNCVNSDSIVVHVTPLPQFNIGADTAVCYREAILLQAGTGFQQVDWYSKSKNTLIHPGSWFFNYTVEATDTIVVRVKSFEGCVNDDSVRIEMLPLPDFDLGADMNVCSLDSVKLYIAGSWKEVNWYDGSGILLEQDAAAYNFRLEDNMTLRAEVFHLNGCAAYDTVNINMLPLPEFDLGLEKNYCAGSEAILDVGNIGVVYTWKNDLGELLSNTSQYAFTASTSGEVFLDVTDSNQCAFSDSVTIEVNPLPVFAINGDNEICEGDKVTLEVDFRGYKSLLWYHPGKDTLAVNENEIAVFPETTDTIFARIEDLSSCEAIQSLAITVHPRPVAHAGADVLLCYGDSASIGGSDPGEPGLVFEWSPPQYLSNSQIANPITSAPETITYSLTVTDTNGCLSRDTVYVEVNPEIDVDAGDNTSICIGDTITLGGTPTASGSRFPYTYQWTSADGSFESTLSNPLVSPEVATVYFVFVTTGKCAVELDSMQVTVNSLPEIIPVGDQSIGAGGSVRLSATGAVSYAWTPAESLDDYTSADPVATPLKTTLYTVVGTDENGCRGSASVEVKVQNVIFIPNLFTPNGDGNNDVFKIYGSGVETISFSVFDEQGNRLYHTRNVSEAFDKGWDGTANGKVMKNDIYIWTIEGRFFNGGPVQFQGKTKGIIKLMK